MAPLRSRSGRVRVLIVDDERAPAELMSVAVTEAGRRPSPAADGESALRIARARAPHAVVPDGMLPDVDGLQVPAAVVPVAVGEPVSARRSAASGLVSPPLSSPV